MFSCAPDRRRAAVTRGLGLREGADVPVPYQTLYLTLPDTLPCLFPSAEEVLLGDLVESGNRDIEPVSQRGQCPGLGGATSEGRVHMRAFHSFLSFMEEEAYSRILWTNTDHALNTKNTTRSE